VAWLRRLHRLGYAAAAGGFWAHHGKNAHAAYFLFPFETMWSGARKGSLKVGDKAPDIMVKTLDAKEPMQLASLWAEKPVVLVFGSYT
jgi:hypothetical protein